MVFVVICVVYVLMYLLNWVLLCLFVWFGGMVCVVVLFFVML